MSSICPSLAKAPSFLVVSYFAPLLGIALVCLFLIFLFWLYGGQAHYKALTPNGVNIYKNLTRTPLAMFQCVIPFNGHHEGYDRLFRGRSIREGKVVGIGPLVVVAHMLNGGCDWPGSRNCLQTLSPGQSFPVMRQFTVGSEGVQFGNRVVLIRVHGVKAREMIFLNPDGNISGSQVSEVAEGKFSGDAVKDGYAYDANVGGLHDAELFSGKGDGVFRSLRGLFGGLEAPVEVYQAQKAHSGSYGSYPIENLGKSKLTFSVMTLISLLTIIIGGWLNSNGVYRRGTATAMVGWALIVGGGFLMLALLVPMVAQFIKV
jgi:hypothetical protein